MKLMIPLRAGEALGRQVYSGLRQAIVAGTLSLPANTLLISAFNKTANPALVSSMDALVLVFALVPDLMWHGTAPSSLMGTKGIGLVLILLGGAWAIYRDARTS